MFHMLSCFDLKDGETVEAFVDALIAFEKHMRENKLIHSAGPVGHRQSDTPMDTDSERDHEYFFVTTFVDRKQCDDAYGFIEAGSEIHKAVISKVKGAVFICWEDIL